MAAQSLEATMEAMAVAVPVADRAVEVTAVEDTAVEVPTVKDPLQVPDPVADRAVEAEDTSVKDTVVEVQAVARPGPVQVVDPMQAPLLVRIWMMCWPESCTSISRSVGEPMGLGMV